MGSGAVSIGLGRGVIGLGRGVDRLGRGVDPSRSVSIGLAASMGSCPTHSRHELWLR
jgi:hypothetical protein